MMASALNCDLKPEELQVRRWPPVGDFEKYPEGFGELLPLSGEEQRQYLASLRTDSERHGKFIQESLSLIYGYVFGYEDSPAYLRGDDQLELDLQRAKIALEREMLEHWLRPEPAPKGLDQAGAVKYLEGLVEKNTGVHHRFFDYVRDAMSRESMVEFLQLEAIRNEVVDDEVAYIVIGLQGELKKTMVSNLWDECGNGKLTGFHTFWLRRLLTALGKFDSLPEYRETASPWFAKATSNSFNMLATRPGYKYRAYGSFLVTESWVLPHFERIVEGMRRVDLDHRDVAVYFTSHIRIDPGHTKEMLNALKRQVPQLTRAEVEEVVLGAHTAVAAGTRLYELALPYFQAIDASVKRNGSRT